jgi:hypothetical protein
MKRDINSRIELRPLMRKGGKLVFADEHQSHLEEIGCIFPGPSDRGPCMRHRKRTFDFYNLTFVVAAVRIDAHSGIADIIGNTKIYDGGPAWYTVRKGGDGFVSPMSPFIFMQGQHCAAFF